MKFEDVNNKYKLILRMKNTKMRNIHLLTFLSTITNISEVVLRSTFNVTAEKVEFALDVINKFTPTSNNTFVWNNELSSLIIERLFNTSEQLKQINKWRSSLCIYHNDPNDINIMLGDSPNNIKYVIMCDNTLLDDYDTTPRYTVPTNITFKGYYTIQNNQIYMIYRSFDTNMIKYLKDDICYKIREGEYLRLIKVNAVEDINLCTNNGKDWIKHYINKPEKGILYFLKLKYKDNIFYKVGITKYTVEKRFMSLPKDIQIIKKML